MTPWLVNLLLVRVVMPLVVCCFCLTPLFEASPPLRQAHRSSSVDPHDAFARALSSCACLLLAPHSPRNRNCIAVSWARRHDKSNGPQPDKAREEVTTKATNQPDQEDKTGRPQPQHRTPTTTAHEKRAVSCVLNALDSKRLLSDRCFFPLALIHSSNNPHSKSRCAF